MNLQDAWAKRQELLAQGMILSDKAAKLKESLYPAGPHPAISFWYSAMSAYFEQKTAHHAAVMYFYQADTVWHDAIVKAHGNIKVTWEEVKDKGWRCKLDNGEVYEP